LAEITTSKQRRKIRNSDRERPKIRHPSPSGDTYPNIIFLSEKDDTTKLSSAAKLYQDIIRYSISKEYINKLGKTFKITDIIHWVLQNNQDYINFYTDSDSKTPKKVRDDGVSKRIHRYIDNLAKWGLISKLEQLDTDAHNGQKTWIYGYTDYGYIIAWMLKFNSNDAAKQIAKEKIFDLLQHQFKAFNSYIMDFLAKLYEKFKKHGLFDILIELVVLSLKSSLEDEKSRRYQHVAEYFSFAQSIILHKYPQSFKLYFETLNDFPDHLRKLIIQQEKATFEYEMLVHQPPKNWQRVWSENVNNYDKIVLVGKCQKCSISGPVICTYYDYRKVMAISPNIDYSLMNCSKCNAKNTLHIYDSMDKFYKYNQ
jgi:hypothetical protein